MRRPPPGRQSQCEGLTTEEVETFLMDTQNPSVQPHAQTRTTGKNQRHRNAHAGGVIHDNSRHTTRFTVIGNHLAQHPELSALAIGLGVHIQSLPAGARADIKTLAARFPEGPTRIAAALRELETHGYLRRTRVRTESGRIVTRTVSCNQPSGTGTRTTMRPTARPSPRPGGLPSSGRNPHAEPSPPYRNPHTPPRPSSKQPSTSSPPSAAKTPASSSPPRTPNTSPPA